jgi:NTE family protein
MAPMPSRKRLAMILSGGGARGAYEVGVLWYVFDELARLRGSPPRVDILSGTSVGAINACFLAAHLLDPMLGLRRLVDLWTEIEITRVLGFGFRQVVSLPRIALGGGSESRGLFDVRPMASLVQREISWRAVARSLRKRQLHALSVSTTEVSTGRTVVFMQTAPDVDVPPPPPRTHFRPDHIGPEHALASAAIPLLFPAVRIDDELYLDGGLRQNTPIAPALRLGATHVFVTGSSREVKGSILSEGEEKSVKAPGAAFLLGKVLNAFLLDHVDVDLELLNRLNSVLIDGSNSFGPEFVQRMSDQALKRGGVPYRYVRSCVVRPSEDIGRMASEHVRRGRYRGDPILTKRLLNLLDLGAGAEADLASYLLFDGTFCRQLIELGRADARARRDELLAFFADAGGGDEGRTVDEGSGTWERSSMLPFGT